MKEIIASFVLVVLVVLVLNPFHFWMPMPLQMMVLGATIAAFGVVAGFVVRERAGDERDVAHRMRAGRVAFLAGTAVLVVGIVVQSFMHQVDSWLVGALAVMVVAKMLARAYEDRYL
ncbi:hypothetical protein EXS56_00425 [Candidatus Kaiserbacteria bacterium]|nr:hypothetical protein [Candidatus Kaiserbacteria bacterium]